MITDALIDELIKVKDIKSILQIISDYLSENMAFADSNPLITYIAENLSKLDNESTIKLSTEAIILLRPRQYQFDKVDTIFKKELAEVYAAKEEYEQGARTLESINIVQSEKSYREKVEIWLLIAEYWFEADDSVNAEKYVNKASFLMHHVQNDQELQLQYKNFSAKIMDSKRQFNIAAWKYYSVANQEGMEQDNVEAMLKCAMACAILSPVGDQKLKIMSALHKDERVKHIDSHYTILDKLYSGTIMKASDIQDFEKNHLQEHQMVTSQDGYTFLQKAILQHNILILSKLYLNISFESLGQFLNIKADEAEKLIGDMITENRLKARLDQFTQSVEFDVQFGGKGVEVAGGQDSQANQQDEEVNKKIRGVNLMKESDRQVVHIQRGAGFKYQITGVMSQHRLTDR